MCQKLTFSAEIRGFRENNSARRAYPNIVRTCGGVGHEEDMGWGDAGTLGRGAADATVRAKREKRRKINTNQYVWGYVQPHSGTMDMSVQPGVQTRPANVTLSSVLQGCHVVFGKSGKGKILLEIDLQEN